jgi:hypothetical protein
MVPSRGVLVWFGCGVSRMGHGASLYRARLADIIQTG